MEEWDSARSGLITRGAIPALDSNFIRNSHAYRDYMRLMLRMLFKSAARSKGQWSGRSM
ncbi:hypothetical protein RSAG8_10320, partial [Rhizoctonia solani AG-8 WAC10335]